jgi:hypothetical protein
MDRRTFLTEAAVLAALSGVSIRITGCSEDSSPTGGGGNPDDVQGVVSSSSGHTHAVSISRATINQGQDVTLTLSVASGHDHTVFLSAAEVMAIGAGTTVQKPSSNDGGHTHQVTFN